MPTGGFDTKLVKDLAKILRDSELSEIEIDHDGTKIRVSRQSNYVQAAMPQPVAQYIAPVAESAPAATKASAATNAAQPVNTNNAVTSPMVGTAYISAEPGAKPFVNVGDSVKEGQQLFIVEAMKTLNAVNAPRAGVVTSILVKDAQPVEFGEALCIIE